MTRKFDVIFCETAREELGNRHSFIGVLGPEAFVGDIPGLLPQLAIVYTLQCAPDELPTSLELEIKLPGDSDVKNIEIAGEQLEQIRNVRTSTNNPHPRVSTNFIVNLVPFHIPEEGSLEARVVVNKKRHKVGDVYFSLGELVETNSSR